MGWDRPQEKDFPQFSLKVQSECHRRERVRAGRCPEVAQALGKGLEMAYTSLRGLQSDIEQPKLEIWVRSAKM